MDIELDVLARSIALQRRALDFASARHDLGATSGLDVAQQQALLDTTLTQVDVLRRQRGQFEHAIATLVGTPAPLFALAPDLREVGRRRYRSAFRRTCSSAGPTSPRPSARWRPPTRRSASRRAAFYPSITLGPSLGTESRTLSTLFDASSLLWSLGVSLTQPLFDAGRLRPTSISRAPATTRPSPTTGASC